MRARVLGFVAVFVLGGTAAFADLYKVDRQSEFVNLVKGKTLSRPFIRLEVTDDGQIKGRGVRWDVTGTWTWENGYFCRDLYWGGDPLGYNCQEVRANGNQIRFTSDQGAGQFADFRLK